nr:MAG TPA_asm: hypothetical protein [Caudoviricetes sp.]
MLSLPHPHRLKPPACRRLRRIFTISPRCARS